MTTKKILKLNKSHKYWKQRNEELILLQVKKGDKWYKDLAENYLNALKRVESDLEAFYKSLDGITLREARKLLKPHELKDFKRQINYFLTDNIREEWKKELEALNERYRVSRLQSLQVKLRQELEVLAKEEYEGLSELSWDVYEDVYYKELYEVTKQIGRSKVFDQIDTRKVEKLNQAGWGNDSKNFNERIWGRTDKLNNFLNSELVRDITLGVDPQNTINKLAKEFNKSKKQAGRLIMTEAAYYSSVAQEEAYDSLDVEQYQIIATLDDRTSEICQELDLAVLDMKDYHAGVTAPPFHPNCRTVTIPYFEDNDIIRIARDKSGEWVDIPGNISYKEWKNTFVV